jgi:hypothetical protein
VILKENHIINLCGWLGVVPLLVPPKTSESVREILSNGNGKHRDDEQSIEEHLEAALRHIRLGLDELDADSGRPHRHHTIARILLALLSLARRPLC